MNRVDLCCHIFIGRLPSELLSAVALSRFGGQRCWVVSQHLNVKNSSPLKLLPHDDGMRSEKLSDLVLRTVDIARVNVLVAGWYIIEWEDLILDSDKLGVKILLSHLQDRHS